jgi:hypothetical protein
MKASAATLAFGVAASAVVWLGHAAEAAAPTTADCLLASDASLRSEGEHQLRAERAQLLTCAAATCPTDIRKECIRRVEEVNAAIPTITFEARDAEGNDISAVTVTMDGEALVERLDGVAIAIDPGDHAFTFQAEGHATARKRFVIREGEKDRREAITFAPTSPPPVAATEAPVRAPPVPASEARAVEAGPGPQAVVGIVVLSAGVVGLGVGTALGLLAKSRRDDAQRACPDRCVDQSGVDMWADASTMGDLSTVAFIAGGAAVVGGAVLWLTAGRGSSGSTRAQVGFGPGVVTVRGRW